MLWSHMPSSLLLSVLDIWVSLPCSPPWFLPLIRSVTLQWGCHGFLWALFKIVFRGQGTALASPLGQRSLKNRKITFSEIAKVTVLKFPRETELMVYCSALSDSISYPWLPKLSPYCAFWIQDLSSERKKKSSLKITNISCRSKSPAYWQQAKH